MLSVRMGRVSDEFAVDAADPHRAERPFPGNVTDGQRRGGPDDAEHVRIVLAIGAQHDALHLDFVEPPFGKEWADRAIRQPAGENLLFRWTAFALKVAARKFPCGRSFFPI